MLAGVVAESVTTQVYTPASPDAALALVNVAVVCPDTVVPSFFQT